MVMKKYLNVIVVFLVIVAVLVIPKGIILVMQRQKADSEKLVIIIDPGHGGSDPGKVGINGANEKEVNLSISLKLKKILEQNDYEVLMTRTEDVGLYSESDPNKKRADLRNRVNLINQSAAVIAVSIHQNSFTQESSKGAQVFYHGESKEGEELANILQNQLKDTIKDGNHRVAKPNESYYMLKETKCPLVIVECGFLSNSLEAQLLCSDEYQEKIAWAIHLGISHYLSTIK